MNNVLLLASAALALVSCSSDGAEMSETRKLNPELPVLKEGWAGNKVTGGRFRNEPPHRNMGFRHVLKWRLSPNPQRKEKRHDKFRPRVVAFDPSAPAASAASAADNIVWLGHSSFLIDIGGVRIATDPAYFSLATMRRRVKLPCRPEQIKNVDYLLISHDHRDHFDRRSVRALAANNPEMEALVPLGGARLFDAGVKVQEAGWYQEYRVRDDVRIILLPAKHWAKRGLADTNRTLWGSFLIIHGERKIFFAGDTAYDPRIFREVRQMFGDMDVCLLPIGAYSPRWFMAGSHTDPEEAARIFDELGGGSFIPMHYGTYDLSDEPAGEPLKLIRRYVDAEKLRVPALGERVRI
jgi:L-ascorbate metabolism protein UlaG (beta-lactamase superfamily)